MYVVPIRELDVCYGMFQGPLVLNAVSPICSVEFSAENPWTAAALLKSTIFEDNNGCISVATSPKMSPRTKHIGVRYHFFKDSIGQDKGIIIKKIDSVDQIADIFTKGLGEDQFQKLRYLLCKW